MCKLHDLQLIEGWLLHWSIEERKYKCKREPSPRSPERQVTDQELSSTLCSGIANECWKSSSLDFVTGTICWHHTIMEKITSYWGERSRRRTQVSDSKAPWYRQWFHQFALPVVRTGTVMAQNKGFRWSYGLLSICLSCLDYFWVWRQAWWTLVGKRKRERRLDKEWPPDRNYFPLPHFTLELSIPPDLLAFSSPRLSFAKLFLIFYKDI